VNYLFMPTGFRLLYLCIQRMRGAGAAALDRKDATVPIDRAASIGGP
jgi:hypothetical protein